MTVNIERLRADLAMQQRQLSWETTKFAMSLVLAAAALVGAGAALGNYIGRQQSPQPPIVIQLPPQQTVPPGR